MNKNYSEKLFNPDTYDRDNLIQIQSKISSSISYEDDFEPLEIIGGSDCAFVDDLIICGIVVLNYNTMDVIEKTYTIQKVTFPYIPTFLSFREGDAIASALFKLGYIPELLMFDGCGINHPRKVGIASHVGAVLDIPTIGVAKKILCGNTQSGTPESVGVSKPLVYKGETIGYLYKSKKGTNPIIIAPGHRVSLESSLVIVKDCIKNHKLPEPTRLAHNHVNDVKKQLQYRSNNENINKWTGYKNSKHKETDG